MKTSGMELPKRESRTNYKVEHLPGIDVVLNLEYPEQKDTDLIMSILKREPRIRYWHDFYIRLGEIEQTTDTNAHPKFFVKGKKSNKPHLDFIKGKTEVDPLNPHLKNIGTEARYAMVGQMSELVLSKKIKNLISSNAFQKLAHENGFANISFVEPIMAVLFKGLGVEPDKFLIYKHAGLGLSDLYVPSFQIRRATNRLRELFYTNGIAPNDLRPDHLLPIEKDGEIHLVLVDTEAYTEFEEPTDSPKS